MIGIPWKEDGRDRLGTDCTGLMQLYFNSIGVEGDAPTIRDNKDKLPQEILNEFKGKNHIVGINGIQSEDILVFKIHNELHVGLYLGYGKMLHADRKGKSRIGRLNHLWEKHFVFGIRAKDGQIYIPPAGDPVTITFIVAWTVIGAGVGIASGGGWKGALFGALGGFLLGPFGIAIGLSFQAKRISTDTPSQRYKFGELETTSTNQTVCPLVYGEVRMGGNVVFQNPISGGEVVDFIVVFCHGEIEGFSDIRLNDEPIGDFPGCSYTAFTGTAEQNVETETGLDLDGIQYRRKACIHFHLETSDKLKGGRPKFTAVIQGTKVSTWNGSSWTSGKTYSSNPSACVRDYLLRKKQVSGCGYAVADLNNDSFGEEYDFCNELVSDGNGGTEARYVTSYAIDQRRSALDNLSEMLIGFAASLITSGSSIKLVINKEKSAVLALDEDDVAGVKIVPKGLDDMVNRFGIEYFDPEQNDTRILAWGAEDKVDQDARGIVDQTITVPSINRFSQASRLSNQYFYELKVNPVSIEFTSSLESIYMEVGDVFNFTHSLMSWTAKPFLCMRIEETEIDTFKITGREYNSTIYNDRFGSSIQMFQYGTPPNPYAPVTDVSGLAVSESEIYINKDGNVASDILVSFTAPADESKHFLSHYQIEYKKGSDDFIVWGGTQETSFRVLNVKAETTYQIKVKTVSINGIISDGAVSSALYVLGKGAPPSDVSGFAVRQDGNDIVMEWAPNTDIDLFGYEIREGDSWDRGTVLITELQDNTWRVPVFSYGERRYMIKAIDTSGNYSNAEAAGVLEVTTTVNIEDLQNNDLDDWQNGDINEISDANEETVTDENGEAYENAVEEEYTQPVHGFEIKTQVDEEEYTDGAGALYVLNTGEIYIGEAIYTDFLQLRYFGDHYAEEGIYVSDAVDLGAKVRGRLSITINVEGEAATYELFISMSDDGVSWSEWSAFASGEYECRFFMIKVVVTNSDTTRVARLWNLKSKATVQFYDDGGEDVAVNETATIPFNKTFYIKVRVYAIAQGSKYARITSKSLSGFNVEVRQDSDGALCAGDVDWIAKGY
ncbi:MAG: NlpC/P60 family protein [Candidatus Omnitrophota bacterium]